MTIKTVLLIGEALTAAKMFREALQEFNEDMAMLNAEHERLVNSRRAMARDALKALWPRVVKGQGLDPVTTMDDGSAVLDCSYLEHGTAFLNIDEEKHPAADDGESVFERLQPTPGSRLN